LWISLRRRRRGRWRIHHEHRPQMRANLWFYCRTVDVWFVLESNESFPFRLQLPLLLLAQLLLQFLESGLNLQLRLRRRLLLGT
jgi:hypothetical protein